jgi:hypothetical protein
MLLNSKRWYETAYRRAVIDMHIPDWDERFLSEFNADTYVDMLVKARAQSVVAYAQSHVGLFNYPTKVGQQHRGLKGRNILAEIIDRCHAREIAVVVYTSLIFDRWSADEHPDWRIVTHNGKPQGEGGRHGVLCPNSPYREYVRAFTSEICENFNFEGIRFDMTFWPTLCFCGHCQRRFDQEVGGEIPRKIDWLDQRWVAFQRRREAWLAEFAAIPTGTVRTLKPNASVEHQSSTYPLNWQFGVTRSLVAQNDFLQGDFYGDSLQGSFVRKLLEDLTPNRPFGYETSFSVELADHTAMKSAELLECKAAAAISDAAAFIFIDAIDPRGTLNPLVYSRMGSIFDRLKPYYPHLGGQRVAEIGIFYSLESKFNFATNGRGVDMPDLSDTHTASSMQVARRLLAAHMPFRVLSQLTFDKLAELKLLILSNVHMMDPEECQAIRGWVNDGGTLIATGGTSAINKRGKLQDDFMLADVLGVSLDKIEWQDREHYVAPSAAGSRFFRTASAKYPIYVRGPRVEVRAHADAQVLATTSLPWPAPDGSRFSSIHSNPPWQATELPEIVLHRFGRGTAVYSSSLIEQVEGLGQTFLSLASLLAGELRFEADAPAAVEMTVFHQPDRHRYVVSLVNFQKDLPNIPIGGIEVRMRPNNEKIRGVTRLPDGAPVPFEQRRGVLSIRPPRLDTLAMLAIETM